MRASRADRVEALDIGQRAFPSEFTAGVFDASQPGAGLRFVRSLGSDRALVVDDQGGKLVMQSTTPLEAASFGAPKRPVDLGLMQSGEGFRSVNPVVPVRISKRLRDGVSLGDDGEIAIVPASESDVTGTESSDRVFFANTQADTDVVVVPRPGGAEISWQLRSPSSPEQLTFDVDMPAGAILRRARSEHPIPGDPPRAIEIAKDGEALGYVYPPIAYDADQQPVKADASIDGKQIVVKVDHRDGDRRYPVFVDPEVVVVGQYTGAYQPWAGWFSAQQPAPATAPNYNRYGAAMNDPAYAYGLYASMPTNTYFDRSNTAVSWLYRAPPNSYIYRAGFANIAHKPLYDGLTFSRWYQGILGSAGTSWEPNVTYNNSRGGIGPNPFGPASGADSGVNHDFCVWNATRNGCYATENAAVNFTEQNYAAFGLHAQNDYNSSLIYTGAQKAYVTMGAAAVFLGDRRPPTVQTQPADRGWTDDTDAATHTLNARATDPGLGVNAITLTGATGGPVTKYAPCNQFAAPSCPLDWTTPTPLSYTLNEGTTTLSLKATDEVGNTSPDSADTTWTHKIDRSKPSLDTPTGPLWESREQSLTEATYDVTLTARDGDGAAPALRRAGVERLDFRLERTNGSVVLTAPDPAPQDCPASSCAKTRTWQLSTDSVDDGTYVVVATATDQIGHSATSSWNVTVDRRPPEPTDVQLEDYDDEASVATIGWNTDSDPEPATPPYSSEVRYRTGAGAWSAWQSTQSDLLEVLDVLAGTVIDLEVRTINSLGVASPTSSQSITATVYDSLTQDFPEGDAHGAVAAVTVVLHTTDGTIQPVGGLPVTVTDQAGARTTILTGEGGVAYFHGLTPGPHHVMPAQAGGVTATTSDELVIPAAGRAEHRMELVIDDDNDSLATRAADSSPDGPKDFMRCVADIPVRICTQFIGDGLRAIFVAEVLFGGRPDQYRADAFKHSYAVSRFTRTMLTKFKDDGPVSYAYAFARGHELDDRQSSDIRVRRASFMDTNNNFVGYNYTRKHPTRNGNQLCSTMRGKSKNARYARYRTGQDEVGVPPDGERTRLIFNNPFQPGRAGTGKPQDAGFYPEFKPCKYAHERYDQGYEGG